MLNTDSICYLICGEIMDKKINLTGKEWWLHLMYWDPDKVEVVNFCDIWRIPFMATFKAFVLCLGIVLLWQRPCSDTLNGSWKSLPYARIFGVRWGNFLLPLYVITFGWFAIPDNSGRWTTNIVIGVSTLLALIIVFALVDDRSGEFTTLRDCSLLDYLEEKILSKWQVMVTLLKKKKTETGTKPKDESVGLFKVLRLRFKSFREKVCYSIPIVRD